MKRLNKKLCVITGAGRGIGAAIAEAFEAEGAHIVAADKDAAEAEAVARRLGGRGFKLDVASEADWDDLQKAVPEADVVVNNAGVTGFEKKMVPHDPENASLEDWREVHRVNLDGTFLGCRYAIRAMRPRRAGSIINISSMFGLVGIPKAAAYASSKAAIRNHTKTVALYCGEQGLDIRCNSICPGAIQTPMWDPVLGDGPDRKDREAAVVSETPLRRFGTPQEVASLAVMLASDEAAYMTGAELTIDGGTLAGPVASPSRD